MTEPPGSELPPDPTIRRLRGRRRLARLAIGFEQLWPALWPPLGVAGAYVCAALLALPQLLPPAVQIALLVLVIAAVGFLLWRGVRVLRRADDAAADRRLERTSGLRHRPLAVLHDRPAAADAAAAALWRLHVARALSQIGRLRVGLPRPGLARRDPRALRAGLLVLLVACLVIAGAEAPARLARAVLPQLPGGAGEAATELQAWITPPAYTGQPPVFLKAAVTHVAVPAGSHLTASVTGGSGEPALSIGASTEAFRRLDTASWQADRDLSASGRLSVTHDGREIGAWDVDVIPDLPPTATWTRPPGPDRRGMQLRLPWTVADDYGVASLQAELRLRDRPDAPPLVVPIPLAGGAPKSAHGVHVADLLAHPWAGLPVRARLVARDAPGQAGQSADVALVLPMRRFLNPAARIVIGVRQALSLHPDARRPAIDTLLGLLAPPDRLGGDDVAAVELGAIIGLLAHDPAPAAVDQAQGRMWQLALRLEEGQPERTALALEAARRAARDALDRAARTPDAAHRAEADRKLQALERAIEQHLRALAEQARREQGAQARPPDAAQPNPEQMQQTAREAEQAAREGRMQDARDKMAQLEKMLQQLRQAKRGQRPGDSTNAEHRREGQKQMSALQDLIRREGGLLDHSQARSTGGQIDSLTGQPLPPPPLTADQLAARDTDVVVQKALRRALGELMQQFGDLTGKIPPPLGDADGGMRDAANALAAGRDQQAAAAEQRVIEALQKSGKDMSQQLTRQFGPGQNGTQQQGEQQQDSDQAGDQGGGMEDDDSQSDGQSARGADHRRSRNERRDPLGREMGQGTTGADEGNDVVVPEQMERQRTRAIQDELRRRGAQRTRPQEELDYIDRLLKQF